jgi:hypothetical protein
MRPQLVSWSLSLAVVALAGSQMFATVGATILTDAYID